jgi:hypothetical protein
VLTLSTSGEGANSLLLRLHFSPHQSLLHSTLSPAIHFNGSNGTAYNRASNGPKHYLWETYSIEFEAPPPDYPNFCLLYKHFFQGC